MVRDRQRGCLIGLAVGDALGAAVEFRAPGTFKPVTGYRSGGPHGLDPGEWTDDTSMALALADSIADIGWDLNDQIKRYIAWWRQGEYSVNGTCFDIGTTTRSALVRFLEYGDAQRSGLSSEDASGNGSIMRLAPVPIRYLNCFPDRIEDLDDLAEESSLTTHASAQCLSACRYMAVVLCGLMRGLDRDEVLSPNFGPLAELRAVAPLHSAIDEVALGSFRRRQPPQIKGSGYVVRSLEAALWAFHDAADFREAVLRAVNLGDDADTTGAVCGQFAGACWGESGIPTHWRDGLARQDMLETALEGLLRSYEDKAAPLPAAAFSIPTGTPPVERSYWVVEGRFLAGAYPGSPDSARHHERVRELWNAGMRTFVNLMEEDETNNSGQPFRLYDDILQQLAQEAGESVTCLRFPVRDLSVPDPAAMRATLDAIDRAVTDGRPVYLHCFGGVGRTGTAVCCWLLRHVHASPDDVVNVLYRLRQADRQTHGRIAPETAEQVNFVKKWLEHEHQAERRM